MHLTGFVFDEVQVFSLEDDNRDMVPMSFDQYNNTLVLSMMRGMSYMPGLGLGRRQKGPHEFTITVDHDISYGLGYIPTADDARHMARLRRERVRARMSGIPFDYPLRPYTFQLADYFIKESKYVPRIEGVDHVSKMAEIQGIQHALGHMCLSSETIDPPEAMIVAPPSPDRASVFSMCFPEEIPDYDLPMDLGDGLGGVIFSDTYTDEMDMIGAGRILDTDPRGPHSDFDMFGVSMIDYDAVTLYDACTDTMDMIALVAFWMLPHLGPDPLLMCLGLLCLSSMVMDLFLLILLMILFLLRERPTLWTHLFLLTLCPGLSPALMTFLMVIMT